MAQAMGVLLQAFPQFADSRDVQQQALMILGVQNPNEVLEQLNNTTEGDPSVALARVLRRFRESLNKSDGHYVGVSAL